MTRILWRSIVLLLLGIALCSQLSQARDNAPSDEIAPSTANDGTQQPVGDHLVSHRKGRPIPRLAGSDAVHEARAILRGIRPNTSKLATFTKPKGVVGSTVYYAKEAFTLLFLNAPAQHEPLTSSSSRTPKLGAALSKAVNLLNEAQEHENPDAIWLLAGMNFYGNFTHPRNYTEAFGRYSQLARLNGNSSAQHMLGFMYATGIGGAVEKDQAKALLYHKFAADGGDIRSQMTLAYRLHAGIGAPRDCNKAVPYYKKVAQEAVRFYKSGPSGGHALTKNSYRLADEDGGIYGEGASVSSSGINAKQGGPTSDAYADFDDVLEYLDFQSRKGDVRATFNMAKLHYDGSRSLKQDMRAAKELFMQIARMYWPSSGGGKTDADVPDIVKKLAPRAAGHLVRMFLRGEGMEQSYTKAKIWFKRGIEHGDALSQYHLGLMYLDGLGVDKNVEKAADLLGASADQDLAVAQTAMGTIFLDQGEVQVARQYFELAARSEHIEAYYYLADIANYGIGRERSCGVAAVYYKIAAEQAEVVHSSFIEANEAYENGDLETALVAYMMAAEQGYENAQANVAFILDQSKASSSLQNLIPMMKRQAASVADSALALIYWTRSAKQQNIDSIVKMGDYYLSGLGAKLSAENAASCYQAAAETMQSAQAMWNLGWMHENGIGLQQDFHLAKRFYDQALDTNKEAYLPVKLSLMRLRLRSWWNDVSHGSVNSIKDEPVEKRRRSFSEWLSAFLEADAQYYADQAAAWEADDWELGDGGVEQTMPGVDGDYYDEIIDDGILESLLIVGLAAVLAFLIYWRQQRQAEAQRRRAEQEAQGGGQAPVVDAGVQQQQQIDPGLFPAPDDPNFPNWVAGGVGH